MDMDFDFLRGTVEIGGVLMCRESSMTLDLRDWKPGGPGGASRASAIIGTIQVPDPQSVELGARIRVFDIQDRFHPTKEHAYCAEGIVTQTGTLGVCFDAPECTITDATGKTVERVSVADWEAHKETVLKNIEYQEMLRDPLGFIRL